MTLDLPGAVAELGGQTLNTFAIDDAICDESHGAGDNVGTARSIPATPATHRGGSVCRRKAGLLRRRSGRIEAHVAGVGRAGRTARPAVDAGAQDGGDEPAVETSVLGLHGPVAAVEVFEHTVQVAIRCRVGLAGIRQVSVGLPLECLRCAMAIFGRRRRGSDAKDAPVAGVAIVTRSSMIGNLERRSGRNVEVHENALNQFNLGTIPHDLTLEVRIPGRAPFEVALRVKVPAKATGRQGYELPAGLELPVTFRGDDADGVEIDWKTFLESDDRKAAVQNAASEASHAKAKAYTEAVPGMTEQAWAGSAAGMPVWLEEVRRGNMTREAFEQQVDTLSRIGQMDPNLAAEGKRTLDAEGSSPTRRDPVEHPSRRPLDAQAPSSRRRTTGFRDPPGNPLQDPLEVGYFAQGQALSHRPLPAASMVAGVGFEPTTFGL